MTPSPSTQTMPDSSSSSSSSSPQHSTASRIIGSVKRTITPNSRRYGHSHSRSPHSMHMYSTPQEVSPPLPLAIFREEASTSTRPTVEQIAMGLHVSRTPHLHSSPRGRHSRSTSHPSTPNSLPLRSSLKKSGIASSSASASGSSAAVHTLPLPTTSSSASCSTITSSSMHMTTTPKAVKRISAPPPVSPRPQQNGSPGNALAALKLRMAKLLPGERKRSLSSSVLGIATTTTEFSRDQKIGARKAVRFDASSDAGRQG